MAARRLEARAEPAFHLDSYGYRPGRSALDAVDKCRRRCWKADWVIDLDIQKFFDSVRWVEDWTLNGPYLDGITFVTALPSGQYLIRQRKSDERQVPKFRSDMTAPEVAAMLETAFRVRGGAVDFRTLGLQPRQFLGYPGFQFDFEHLDNDELWRKGRAVGAVVEGRLYLILFDATRSHYYGNALPDFEVMANNARIRSS